LFSLYKSILNSTKGGIILKLLKEFAYQCLLLVTVFGLVFVAFDLSATTAAAFDKVDENTAVKVFSSLSSVLQDTKDGSGTVSGSDISYLRNILLPFIIYLLSCGGFLFLISENIKLWRTVNRIRPISKLMWAVWIVILVLMSLLPVYLGTSLIFEGLWYIYIVIAVLFLFYWAYWVSKN